MWFTSFFEGTVPRYATFYTEGRSCFDCYRVKRTSSRAGSAPAGDQRLFTAHSGYATARPSDRQAMRRITSVLPPNRVLATDELPFFRATIESCQTAEPNQSSTGRTR